MVGLTNGKWWSILFVVQGEKEFCSLHDDDMLSSFLLLFLWGVLHRCSLVKPELSLYLAANSCAWLCDNILFVLLCKMKRSCEKS